MSGEESAEAVEAVDVVEGEPLRLILRVVKGDPTAEQLAALVAVVTARAAAGAGDESSTPPSDWASYWRGVRRPLPHGRGAWRNSALPS